MSAILALTILAAFFLGWQVGLEVSVCPIRHRGVHVERVFGPLVIAAVLTIAVVVMAHA